MLSAGFLYSIGSRQRVLEYVDLGSNKSKYNEQKRQRAKECQRNFIGLAQYPFGIERASLIKVRDRGGNKENSYIYPIGRLADNAVIGIEKYGYKNESEKNTSKLNAPKILSVTKEKALYDSVNKHRPKEKLNMLPGRLVNSRKRRYPYRLAEPIV